ncbi:MurR/RpiR family transcriptional regulator [Vagococcus fluvialis]|uniref:MurR/RpiR family transcriptional regulator n=2 Tax=Vagococcus fluvialis TaxID=2738 RepID=UPI001A8DED8E|nr:MurR/RpiR family transcriptional regulator [Vagococcus fluvialis]MBO0480380.1 MurR/RpiR family transcriptional regulator [Vagococcus fluvialis]MBO0484234.1 MurR/RpiR family transcriptional regulator [Vagococcus fluvialis]UDM71313.1 MurR/RpiR family transcriptional regulator [Vagococcus fluvialis]UDM76174.1 MurR/RpiR family transcriptional regulator [Vagococcus fluvialis]UDM83002.1 MurR/RpiR family transcriptional regulator [Vagococcus fluvialis]
MTVLADLSKLTDLTPNEKELVSYIKKNPKEVLSMSSKELAEASFVSVATLYRLLSKLNLTSFSDLKVSLATNVRDDLMPVDPDYPIQETDTTHTSIQKMKSLYQQTLDDTFVLFDEETMENSIALMNQAKVIDVYSSSANLHLAKNFKFQMQEIGCLINVPDEDYVQRLSAANSDENHLAIVISYGGRGQTTIEVMKILEENKTPILLITSSQNNPFLEKAREVLYLSSNENHYNKISSFSTRFSILMVLDILYANYFNQNSLANKEYKLANYQKMNRDLT